MFHEADVGFPLAGPHAFEGDPAAEQRFRSAIRRAVSSRIVDSAATGYGILDVETWRPAWSLCSNVPSSAGPLAADRDFKDDWRQFVQDRRPKLLSGILQDQFESVYERSFDASARRIFLLFIEECRRIRPGVRWGFYMYPPRVVPGPDGSMPAPLDASQQEAELGWLYEASDVLFPDVCQLRFTVADPSPDRRLTENSADENEAYIDRNIAEAKKAAAGKSVVAILWPRYPRTNKQYGDRFLNSMNLRQSLEGARAGGAAGVAIWDVLTSQERCDELQEFVTQSLVPAVQALQEGAEATATPAEAAVASSSAKSYSTGRTGVVLRRAPGAGPVRSEKLAGRRSIKIVGRDKGQRELNILRPPSGFSLGESGTDVVLRWLAPENGATGVRIEHQRHAPSGSWEAGATIDAGADMLQVTDAAGPGEHEYRIATVRGDEVSAFTSWLRLVVADGAGSGSGQPGTPPSPPPPTTPTDPPADPTTPPESPTPPTDPQQPPTEPPTDGGQPQSSAPATPVWESVSDVGNALEVSLSWSESAAGVSGFRVQRRTQQSSGAWGEPLDLLSGAGATRMVDRPGVGVHEYRIAAIRDGLVSEYSPWNRITVRSGVPEIPTALGVADSGNGRDVELSWIDNSSNETAFRIERMTESAGGSWGGLSVLAAPANATRLPDSPGPGSHQYRIAAENGTSGSDFSAWVGVTVIVPAPAMPTGFSALDGGNGRDVELSWVDAATNESGFRIERQTLGGDGSWGSSTAITSPADSTRLSDSPGMGVHRYRIAAVSDRATSDVTSWSTVEVLNPAPSAPGDLVATDLGNGLDVQVAWIDQSSNETGFRIERQTQDSGGAWSESSIIVAAAGATRITDRPGVGSHRYRVAAVRNEFMSEFTVWQPSTVVSPPPSSPSAFGASDAGDGNSVNLRWVDESPDETGFVIERQTQADNRNWIDSTTMIAADVNATGLVDRPGSGTHRYRIAARRDSRYSTYSGWVPVVVAPLPPPAIPVILSVVDAGNGRDVRMTWTDATSDVSGFQVERQSVTTDGSWGTTVAWLVEASAMQLVDAAGIGTHRFRVAASRGSATSAFAAWKEVIVQPGAPDTPTALSASDAGNELEVGLSWRDNSSDETGFLIQRQTRDSTGAWGQKVEMDAPANATRFVDAPGLGTHEYRIASTNAGRLSAYSDWVVVSVTDGWTRFTPSTDTRTVYVSSSTGNDANSGLSEASPIRTLAAARAKVRQGYPDWVLLKCGDTFVEADIEVWRGGRSPTEPALWSSYGTGPRPIVTPTGTWPGMAIMSSGSNLAIVGLQFTAASGGGASGIVLLVGSEAYQNLLIEDCYIEKFKDNINIQGRNGGTNVVSNVKIRRSIIVDAYPPGGAHSQGAYINSVDGLLIEECVFDHNGWKNSDRSDATIYNHNLYLGTENSGNTIVRRNIIAQASSHGLQLRAGGTIEGNLFLLNPIATQLGGGDPNAATHTNGVTGTVSGNVVLSGLDINATTPRGWGILAYNIGTAGAVIRDNIVAHNSAPGDTNAMPLYIGADTYGGGVGANNMQIRGNVFYDWKGACVFRPAATPPPSPSAFCTVSGIVFDSNQVQMPRAANTTSNCVRVDFASTSAAIAFNNNTYWTNRPDDQQLRYNNTAMSLSQWSSATGDTGSRVSRLTYVDAERTIASYNQTLGGAADTAAFLASARQQRRSLWRAEYTAAAAIAHIREGFVVVP
ncbi:MAG: hypothetical protein JSR77_11680 [Planctomycetes bacterium]|nr:hypothetical protein [Planctomycetota bacterium]